MRSLAPSSVPDGLKLSSTRLSRAPRPKHRDRSSATRSRSVVARCQSFLTPAQFSFDHSYNSAVSRDDPQYASQDTLYQDLGRDLLEHSFQGFNVTTFAYGQTGSGKSCVSEALDST